MTEKRFNMNKSGDLYDKDNLLMLDFGYAYDGVGCKRIIDLLNELNDDNEQLKQTVSDWSGSYDELFEDVKRLEEENEQLKHRIVELQNDLNNYSEIFNELNALVDENEQLKQIRDVAFEFAEKPTQHNLWKFRSFLKEYNSER